MPCFDELRRWWDQRCRFPETRPGFAVATVQVTRIPILALALARENGDRVDAVEAFPVTQSTMYSQRENKNESYIL